MTAATIFKENKIILSLRIVIIIFAIVGCCAHGYAYSKQDLVYTDGVGAVYEAILVIAVCTAALVLSYSFLKRKESPFNG